MMFYCDSQPTTQPRYAADLCTKLSVFEVGQFHGVVKTLRAGEKESILHAVLPRYM